MSIEKKDSKKIARLNKILDILCKDLHERREIVAMMLLGVLAKQNTFLYGPPGTAKSLLARRVSMAFDNSKYFEYLMQKFSKPDEVFGPISISELKKDNLKRITENYLPTSDFAFLDEIWKSNSAILNSLLTIINEKIFKNGNELVEVPLKGLITASNEIPEEGQGLDALYDRFTLRISVPPIKERENFEKMLKGVKLDSNIEISKDLAISKEELEEWSKDIQNIEITQELFDIIHSIRSNLTSENKDLGIYISDRRWKNIALLLKAVAYFSDRDKTSFIDAFILKYCLWTKEENREKLEKLIDKIIKEKCFHLDSKYYECNIEKEKLEKDIKETCFYKEDKYETIEKHGKEFFEVIIEDTKFYIPIEYFKKDGEFYLLNENGNRASYNNCNVTGDFIGQGTCYIQYSNSSGFYSDWKNISFTPKKLWEKGDKNLEVIGRFINTFRKNLEDLKNYYSKLIKEITEYRRKKEEEIISVFLTAKDKKIALENIDEMKKTLELALEDCKRISSLID